MTNKQRLDHIEDFIRQQKYVDLHTIATEFGISISTVRRALNDLEQKGGIRRHHGGASVVEDPGTGGYDFITQDDTNADEKHWLASYLAARLQPGMSVMLDGGTTTYAVARLLANKRVIVITNSLPIAALLNEVSACETVMTGGTLYHRLGVLYGPICEATLAEMHADVAIMGCAGVTAEGIWNSNPLISAYQRKMMQAADQVYFAADSSKFGKRAMTLTTPHREGLQLVTGVKPSATIESALRTAGTRLLIAGQDSTFTQSKVSS
ncbi:MAG: DeoR/GlpR family DNA-binding transcription regulator [Verrucomicrobia bacterium]|nr:DeoR/GlpR family DNA-binding transcription regulator [Verrucomicrobiota bacterium]